MTTQSSAYLYQVLGWRRITGIYFFVKGICWSISFPVWYDVSLDHKQYTLSVHIAPILPVIMKIHLCQRCLPINQPILSIRSISAIIPPYKYQNNFMPGLLLLYLLLLWSFMFTIFKWDNCSCLNIVYV